MGLYSNTSRPPVNVAAAFALGMDIYDLNCLVDLFGLNTALEPSQAFHPVAKGARCLCQHRHRARIGITRDLCCQLH